MTDWIGVARKHLPMKPSPVLDPEDDAEILAGTLAEENKALKQQVQSLMGVIEITQLEAVRAPSSSSVDDEDSPLKHALHKANAEIKELRSKVDVLNADLATLNADLACRVQNETRLREENQQAGVEMEEFRLKLKQDQKKRDEEQEAQVAGKLELISLSAERADLEREEKVEKLRAELASAKAGAEEKQVALTLLKTETDIEIEKLRTELGEKAEEAASFEKAANSTIAALQLELDQLRDQEQQCATLREARGQYEQRAAQAQSEAEAMKREKARVERELSTQQQQLGATKLKLSAVQQQREALEETVVGVEGEMQHIKAARDREVALMDDWRRQAEGAEEVVSRYRVKGRTQQQLIKELRDELRRERADAERKAEVCDEQLQAAAAAAAAVAAVVIKQKHRSGKELETAMASVRPGLAQSKASEPFYPCGGCYFATGGGGVRRRRVGVGVERRRLRCLGGGGGEGGGGGGGGGGGTRVTAAAAADPFSSPS